MSYQPVSGIVPQYSNDSNELASGYYLKFYIANTTTPLSMATDSTGGTLLVKAKLNPDGLPISNPLDNDTVFIPHVNEDYRLVIYRNEADADANNTAGAFLNVPDVKPLVGSGLVGAETVTTSTGSQTVAGALDDRVVKRNTVAAMKISPIVAGVKVKTNTYAGVPGSGAEYLIKTAAEATADGDTVDEIGSHTLNNGNVAIIQFPSGYADPLQFGLIGDKSVEESAKIQAAINTGLDVRMLVAKQIVVNSPIVLKPKRTFELGHSVLFPQSAYSVIQIEQVGAGYPATGGQFLQAGRFNIDGRDNPAIKNDPLSKGLDVNKYLYNSTLYDIEVRDLYYGHDDPASFSFQMTFNNFKAIACRVGFRKVTGTTYIFNDCYTLACNQGWLLSNLTNSVANSHAADGGFDYLTDNLYNAIRVDNGSELTFNGLDLETNEYSRSFIDINNSNVVINSLRLWNTTINTSTGFNNFVAATNGSRVLINIPRMSPTNIEISGGGDAAFATVNDSEFIMTMQDLNDPTNLTTETFSHLNINNSNVRAEGVPRDKIIGSNYALTQDKYVQIYVKSAGDDAANGLSFTNALANFNRAAQLVNERYNDWDVDIILDDGVTFERSEYREIKAKQLKIRSRSELVGTKPILNINKSDEDDFRLAGIYGPRNIIFDNIDVRANVTAGDTLSTGGRGVVVASRGTSPFSATLGMESVNFFRSKLTYNNDVVCLVESLLFGFNSFFSVGTRDSEFANGTASSATTKYVVHLTGTTAAVREGGHTRATGIDLTNGTAISTSNIYEA